ncbi:MAG: energy transducer TonB [Alphaproteobacteria bacterium]
MKRGLIGSGILHASAVALVAFGLPELFRKEPREDVPVVFEVVTVSERATAPEVALPPPQRPLPKPVPQKVETPPPPRPEPPKPEPPKAEAPPPPPPPPEPPKVAAPKPEPPKPEPPKPEPPKAEPRPEPPKPEPPKPEPPKTVAERPPEPVPTPKPPTKKPEPPKAEPKPEPPKPEPPKQAAKVEPKPAAKPPEPRKETKPVRDFDVNAVLNNLRPSAPRAQNTPPAPTPQPPRQQVASAAAPLLSQNLSSSEIDAVRQQIERCWSFIGGGKEVAHIEVDIRVWMNPDATVQDTRIVDQLRYQSDPLYRSVAESARRAIRNPECSPLRLPRDKYELWKTFTFTFRPRDFGT